jgi:glycosyltransferase involved in cell wall biosynthesis
MGGLAVQVWQILRHLPHIQFTLLCPNVEPLQLPHARAFTLLDLGRTSTDPYMIQQMNMENMQYLATFWHLVNQHQIDSTQIDVIWSLDKYSALAAEFIAQSLQKPWVWTCALSLAVCDFECRSYWDRIKPVSSPQMQLPLTDYQPDAWENQAWLRAPRVTFNGDWWQPYFPPHRKDVYSIPNGINLEEIQSIQPWSRAKLPGQKRYKLLFVGRIVSSKGISLLTRPNVLPVDTDLIIVGQPDQQRYDLEQLLKQGEKQNQWYWLGPIFDSIQKYGLMKSVDAIIVPSIHEPWGIVAMEAMACQTPLIYNADTGINSFAEGWPLQLKHTHDPVGHINQRISKLWQLHQTSRNN